MKKFSALNTLQLRYLLRKLIKKARTYVVAIDQLKFIKEKSFAVVLNNQESNEAGLHWIALYKARNSREIEMFDSFGLPLKFYGKAITNFAVRQNARIRRNSRQIQSNYSMMCGYMSVYFLVLRSKGVSYEKILSNFNFNNFKENEKVIRSFFERVKFPKLSMCGEKCIEKCEMNRLDFSSVCIQKNRRCIKI